MSVILACDLGGSGLRAALVDEGGSFLADAFEPLAVPLSAGESEVDPVVWWTALERAVTSLARARPRMFDAVEAVSICGMTRTQVFLGATGEPVRPAMTWRDTRAADMAREDGGGEVFDAFHPVSRLAWVAENERQAARAIVRVVEPKDYLAARLTGRIASDPVALARLAAPGSAAWHHLLPDLIPPGAILAPVLPLPGPWRALAGRPVVMASHDTFAAVVGLGAMRPGLAYNISGTSEVLGLMATSPAPAPGLLRVAWHEGLEQIGGPSQNGADALAWLARILGSSGDPGGELDRLLASPRAGAPVLYLPFLSGERTPYWDAALRAAFLGLSREHGPADLAWAVLEGTGHAAKVVLDLAEEAAGGPAAEIRIGGGGARSAVWRQVKADILGRRVVMGECAEPGLLGCAALAFTALGRFETLAVAQERLFRPAFVHEPSPTAHAAHREIHRLYRAAVDAVAPLSRALQGVATSPLAVSVPLGENGSPQGGSSTFRPRT